MLVCTDQLYWLVSSADEGGSDGSWRFKLPREPRDLVGDRLSLTLFFLFLEGVANLPGAGTRRFDCLQAPRHFTLGSHSGLAVTMLFRWATPSHSSPISPFPQQNS